MICQACPFLRPHETKSPLFVLEKHRQVLREDTLKQIELVNETMHLPRPNQSCTKSEPTPSHESSVPLRPLQPWRCRFVCKGGTSIVYRLHVVVGRFSDRKYGERRTGAILTLYSYEECYQEIF